MHEKAKSVLKWAEQHMKSSSFSRDDYRELCCLVVEYLGGNLSVSGKPQLRKPGAMHEARFMADALYILKMTLLDGSQSRVRCFRRFSEQGMMFV